MLTAIFWLIFLLWICASIILVLVVLVQSGKGGGLSGLVGGGGGGLSDQLGATGAEKTLNRWTSYCAIGFLVLNIVMVLMGPAVFRGSLIDQAAEEGPDIAITEEVESMGDEEATPTAEDLSLDGEGDLEPLSDVESTEITQDEDAPLPVETMAPAEPLAEPAPAN